MAVEVSSLTSKLPRWSPHPEGGINAVPDVSSGRLFSTTPLGPVERTCVSRCEQPEQGEHEQPHRSACRGGEGCGDDGEGGAAHRHRAAVLLKPARSSIAELRRVRDVGAEGAAVGLDCGEQRRPAARALALVSRVAA
eukprot:scaffold2950_cov67-Phaeocystis_antarctica.AAC.3